MRKFFWHQEFGAGPSNFWIVPPFLFSKNIVKQQKNGQKWRFQVHVSQWWVSGSISAEVVLTFTLDCPKKQQLFLSQSCFFKHFLPRKTISIVDAQNKVFFWKELEFSVLLRTKQKLKNNVTRFCSSFNYLTVARSITRIGAVNWSWIAWMPRMVCDIFKIQRRRGVVNFIFEI
jgi:hypothetical protein